MKKIKKLVAIALAAVMVFALGSVAFAEIANPDGSTSEADTGNIVINGLEKGVTASAYKIAEATYDGSGNFLGYEMTVSGADTTWKINSDGSYDTLTEKDLAALYAALGSTDASGTATADGDGIATITDLGVGSYLIVITGGESTVYSMMIGSVSYTTENGDWATYNGSIDTVSDENLWAKAATPTIDKEEVDTDTDSDTHGDSAEVGDEVTFHITVESIPHYDGSYPTFEVDDVLSGLVITDAEHSSLKVTIDDTELTLDTDYTVEWKSDNEFIVNFVVDDKYTLNAYEGQSLVIEYKATVTEDAIVDGVSDHSNEALLTFSTNSYVSGSDSDPGTPEDPNPDNPGGSDTSHEYSFSASFEKVGSDTNNEGLAGATFTIYDADGSEHGTAISGEDGSVTFTGLKEGKYTFKETEAPAGYLLNTAVYNVEISASYNEDGSISTWSIVITDENGDTIGSATQSADTGLTIINTKTGILPSTGGRGTLIFTIIGCAIVVCAVVGVAATRRRRAA